MTSHAGSPGQPAALPSPRGAVPGSGQAVPGSRRAVPVLRALTVPARLRLLLIVLVAVSAAWGVVAAWTVGQHASAAGGVASTSEPLSVDAQQIYRALSDADATAAAGFLSGGLEPITARQRYAADVARAASSLAAATGTAGQVPARSRLATLAADLPVYTGLVETARADNRLGLPVGAAYLRQASGLMRATLLPAAREAYVQANAQLAGDDGRASGWPFVAVAAIVVVGVALIWAQRWLARRSHRLFNRGLVVASVVGLASAVWLLSALTFARVQVIDARDHGSAPVEALAQADIAALQARDDESLTLIDRGGDDSFQQDFLAVERRLGPGAGTLLTAASTAASGSPGAGPAAAAARGAPAWFAAHQQVRRLDDSGNYSGAVQLAIGSAPGGSGTLFNRLDTALTTAIGQDQAGFRSTIQSARSAFTGLEAGMIVLSLVMVAGCAWGLAQRIAEYR
ncbi:MAG TPA: hypothetical protein VKD26_09435 [Streptosporangiaceae bacterium]|nr:hypothetical protein [Streptosporangiaceae bacterium]